MPLRELQVDMQRHLLGDESAVAGGHRGCAAAAHGAALGDLSQRLPGDGWSMRLTKPTLFCMPCWAMRVWAASGRGIRRRASFGAPLDSLVRRRTRAISLPAPPYSEQPILSEVALLEWTLAEVFDAADADPQPRARSPPSSLRLGARCDFEFHPSLRRLELQLEHRGRLEGDEPRGAAAGAGVAPAPGAVAAVAAKSAELFSLDECRGSGGARVGAARRATSAQICEALAEWLPEEEIPLRAASLLGAWADSGIIVAID